MDDRSEERWALAVFKDEVHRGTSPEDAMAKAAQWFLGALDAWRDDNAALRGDNAALRTQLNEVQRIIVDASERWLTATAHMEDLKPSETPTSEGLLLAAAWLDFIDDVYPAIQMVCNVAPTRERTDELQRDLRKWAALAVGVPPEEAEK